jgi:hypothetical protein
MKLGKSFYENIGKASVDISKGIILAGAVASFFTKEKILGIFGASLAFVFGIILIIGGSWIIEYGKSKEK